MTREKRILESQDAIKALWPNENVLVDVFSSNGTITVRVGREYDPLPLTGPIILALINLFGTSEYTVNQYAISGCETCDWGSNYGHEFTLQEFTSR